MKKETKVNIVIFILIFVVGYMVMSLLPEPNPEKIKFITDFFGNVLAKIAIKALVPTVMAIIVVFLIKIVDSEEQVVVVEPKKGRRTATKKSIKKGK